MKIMDKRGLKFLVENSFLLNANKKQYFLENIDIIPEAILEGLLAILIQENQVVKKTALKAEKKLLASWLEIKTNMSSEINKKFSEKLKGDEKIKNEKVLKECEKLLNDFN